VTKVLIPEENKKDIEEIPKRILKRVELVLVPHMDDVLKQSLVLKEGEILFASEKESAPFCIEISGENKSEAPADVRPGQNLLT
jgi:ATP-dependent Lon protease